MVPAAKYGKIAATGPTLVDLFVGLPVDAKGGHRIMFKKKHRRNIANRSLQERGTRVLECV